MHSLVKPALTSLLFLSLVALECANSLHFQYRAAFEPSSFSSGTTLTSTHGEETWHRYGLKTAFFVEWPKHAFASALRVLHKARALEG